MILWLIAFIAAISGGLTAWLFRRGGPYNPVEPPVEPQEPSKPPVEPPTPLPEPVQPPTEPYRFDFSTPKKAWHSTRVIADEMGLTYEQKNILCACIFQESRFDNRAIGKNAKSTDWGIVQINDTKGWHIGAGLQFPSIPYVIDHPEECVRWMIKMQKAGKLFLWSSYAGKAYLQWLPKTSAMWKLSSLSGENPPDLDEEVLG